METAQPEQLPLAPYAAPLPYLAATLDCLNLWQDNGAGQTDEAEASVDFPALRF